MSPSLSVLLPVHNAQATLAGLTADLLEVLPDLTSRFDMQVIDDGSLDATSEAAHDLSRRFPQIQVIRNAARLGRAATLRSGLQRSKSQLVLLREETCLLDPHDLHKLWRGIGTHDAALGRAGDPSRPDQESWVQRIKIWSLGLPTTVSPADAAHGWQLYRRSALETIGAATTSRRELLTELSRRRLSWTEVELRSVSRQFSATTWQPVRIDPKASRPLRPGHIARIKAFALGE